MEKVVLVLGYCFKSGINRHLLTVGSFWRGFLYAFNLFVLLFLVTPCLSVAVQSCWSEPQLKKNVFHLGKLQGKRVPKCQIMSKDTLKGHLSLQFHDFHSMRSHPYLKVIWQWSYTCFRVFEVVQQFGKIASQCPNSCRFAHFNFLNI